MGGEREKEGGGERNKEREELIVSKNKIEKEKGERND